MLTRNLKKAKEAYKKKDKEASLKAHDNLSHEEYQNEHGKYIKSLVYGGLDGIITTFAVVAGVTGAKLSVGIVLILGFANLLADGVSMAVGDYLSSKAEKEYNNAEYEREKWEVENYPEGEKRELEELFIESGIESNDAKDITKIISKYKKAWLSIMMVLELGIINEEESPIKNALFTFFSFVIFGFIPLLSYVISSSINAFAINSFFLASVLTLTTLFILGAIKTKVTEQNPIKSGFEMLIVGGAAATLAYLVGVLLQSLAH